MMSSDKAEDLEVDQSEQNEPTKSAEKKLPYPKWVGFIVGSNFTERFSYYGMKAILTLFFVEKMFFTEKTATITYHIFCSLCYFTPVLGAIISDARLGKFKTIVYFTIVYTVGGFLLSGSAVPGMFWGVTGMKIISSISLLLIAVGSGCIKPCLAAFGGDQFGPGQEKALDSFFSAFYVSISCGSLISMFLTPLLRSGSCFGERNCYPLAFGVPAFTITFGLILIVCGRKWYIVHPPGNNVIGNVVSCVSHAVRKRLSGADHKPRAHWLDYADDDFSPAMIADVKCLMKVLFLYLPLPLFFTLFDQQGSRWTLQATKLSGQVTESVYVQPDHMQLLNPLIIVVGTPFFDYVIYPLCAKMNLLTKPLQRMSVGGMLAAVAFFVACFLQMAVDRTQPRQPNKDMGTVMLLNALPCDIRIVSGEVDANITADNFVTLWDVPPEVKQNLEIHPIDCKQNIEKTGIVFEVTKGEVSSVAVIAMDNQLDFYRMNDSVQGGKNGQSSVRVIYHLLEKQANNITFSFQRKVGGNEEAVQVVTSDLQEGNVGSTGYAVLYPGTYKISTGDQRYDGGLADYKFLPGGRYIVLVTRDKDGTVKSHLLTLTKANAMSMFLQIPQYLLITCAEIMFSISGIQFSYSQAPASMKSLVQAAWLILIAFGNVIMVLVSKLSSMTVAVETLVFACAMVIDMVIFSIMAYYYRYSEVILLVKDDTKDKTEPSAS